MNSKEDKRDSFIRNISIKGFLLCFAENWSSFPLVGDLWGSLLLSASSELLSLSEGPDSLYLDL